MGLCCACVRSFCRTEHTHQPTATRRITTDSFCPPTSVKDEPLLLYDTNEHFTLTLDLTLCEKRNKSFAFKYAGVLHSAVVFFLRFLASNTILFRTRCR